MPAGNDLQQRLNRLVRLRKLGVRRGARDLPAAPASPQPRAAVRPTPPAQDSAHVEGDTSATANAAIRIDSRSSASHFQAGVSPISDILPGEEVATPFGPAWVRTVRFPLAERPDLAEWLAVTPASLAALDRSGELWALQPARAAFIDTETTGLSLGAGTYTFLIGVGTYEDDAFVVRQCFMRSPAEERAQLHLVEQVLTGCTGIISFNGRGFDMPLIHNRFVLASMPLPLVGAPHLDLLPPARRLWKARWGSCSLGNLERNVLAFQRTTEDVPGYLIPDIYRQYYLTGVATDMLARVFYHNLEDIASMPLLGAQMARFFQPESVRAQLAGLHPLEALSLGRCYDALGWAEEGIVAYRTALDRTPFGAEMTQILRELGYLYKRLARHDDAAEVWEAWISAESGADLTPYIELAKHHEWRTLDLAAARGWAAWALRIAEAWPPGYAREETVADLRHRLERLERKLAGEPPDIAQAE